MKNPILWILVFGIIFISCEKESATKMPSEDIFTQNVEDQTNNNAEASLRGKQPRPFKGTIVYNNVSSNDLVCDCPSGIPVLLEGSGNITHMGNVSSPAKYCLIPNGATNCPVGHLVLKECLYVIAANGDEVHLDVDAPYDSCIEPGCCITGTLQGTFNGGTGRFSNASGTWTAEFIQYLTDPTSEVTVDGDIMY